jgi:carbon-monoxide dehydrogenase small subunit
MTTLHATVNGKPVEVPIEPQVLLVDLLRGPLRLTGTHVGCDTTQCGACTVLVDGESVKSCTMLAIQAEGRTITTIEGLAQDGAMHPVQEAFIACHGLQCGFCTPGMIMAATCLLSKNPQPSEAQIVHGLEGNICRCTGYVNIVESVRTAAVAMAKEAA